MFACVRRTSVIVELGLTHFLGRWINEIKV